MQFATEVPVGLFRQFLFIPHGLQDKVIILGIPTAPASNKGETFSSDNVRKF